MNGMKSARLVRLLLPWLAGLLCSACASFSDRTLPERSLDDLEREGRLIPVTYEFSEGNTFANLEALNQASAPAATPSSVLQSRVEPIFRRVFTEATRQHEPG